MRKNPYSLSLSSSNLTATRSSSPSQTSATSNDESPEESPRSSLQISTQFSNLAMRYIDTNNLEDISDVSTNVTYVKYEEKKYYHVMYFRNSSNSPPSGSKKGVLVVGDFNAALYGMRSNVIARESGAKIQKSIKQKYFYFKNIEVQILEEFPEKDFLRGKCFLNHLVETVYSNKKTKKLRKLSNVPEESYVIDSKKGVYIDKEIISILKEHQIHGVEFLYDSVMNKKKGISGGILAVLYT
jgi:hypothetical protein